jgi:hypothetical protein
MLLGNSITTDWAKNTANLGGAAGEAARDEPPRILQYRGLPDSAIEKTQKQRKVGREGVEPSRGFHHSGF